MLKRLLFLNLGRWVQQGRGLLQFQSVVDAVCVTLSVISVTVLSISVTLLLPLSVTLLPINVTVLSKCYVPYHLQSLNLKYFDTSIHKIKNFKLLQTVMYNYLFPSQQATIINYIVIQNGTFSTILHEIGSIQRAILYDIARKNTTVIV